VLEVEESTLSRNILRLERVISVKLFIRSRIGVTMTVAAASSCRAGELAVGYNGPVSAGNFRATLFEWLATKPEVDLEGIEAERTALLAGLDAGVIDLAVMPGEASYLGCTPRGLLERAHPGRASGFPSAHRK